MTPAATNFVIGFQFVIHIGVEAEPANIFAIWFSKDHSNQVDLVWPPIPGQTSKPISTMAEWLWGTNLGYQQMERHVQHDHFDAVIPQPARVGSGHSRLGTMGYSGLPLAQLGSVAEDAFHEAPCHVVRVRPTRFSFELP
jgi:hypothetical protein